MNVFAVIRRAIWAVLLAACVVVGCVYLAFSQTFLTSEGLTRIVAQSKLTETVKEETLLPRVLTSTRSSDYSTLLDDKLVTDTFNSTITTEALNAKLTPAIDALQLWLNSKEPSIQFTISMTDLSDQFAAKLTEGISAKVAALPACTRQNTLADAETGVCRSPLITEDVLRTNINQAITSDPTLRENVTITPENIPELTELRSESSLPSYLNMFYAFTLVTAGLGALITLWLLLKHRLAGIIAIGSAALLAAVILFAGATVSHAATARVSDPLASKVTFAATSSFATHLQPLMLSLVIGGIVTIIIATIALLIIKRRRASRETVSIPPTNAPPTQEA